MEPIVLQLLIMAAFGGVVSMIANDRGRSPLGWFFIGALTPCIGLILVLVLPNAKLEEEQRRRVRRDHQRLREEVRKDRQVSDQRNAETARRIGAHDAVLGLDTGAAHDASDPDAAPPQLPARRGVDDEPLWHFAAANDSESVGPISVAELRELWRAAGQDGDAVVWKKGMADWSAIRDLPALQERLRDV